MGYKQLLPIVAHSCTHFRYSTTYSQQGDNVVKVTTQRNNINDVTATMARINGIPDETMERISTAAFSSVVGGDVNNINPVKAFHLLFGPVSSTPCSIGSTNTRF